MLLEQKENWVFHWTGKEGVVVVFPCLVKGEKVVVRGADVERV